MKKYFATLILLTVMSSAFAQEKQVPLVHVNGESTLHIEPDGATVNVTISTTNLALKAAKSENDEIASKAISYLKSVKIADKEMRTTRVTLQPYNEYVKDEKPIQMFRAQQSITFDVKDLDKLTGILSGLVDAGVNTIENIQFTSSKMSALQDQARKEAMLDAQRKAKILAEALGQELGKAFAIHDNTSSGGNMPIAYRAFAKADMASEQAPIATGEIEVKANVQVSFELSR